MKSNRVVRISRRDVSCFWKLLLIVLKDRFQGNNTSVSEVLEAANNSDADPIAADRALAQAQVILPHPTSRYDVGFFSKADAGTSGIGASSSSFTDPPSNTFSASSPAASAIQHTAPFFSSVHATSTV